MGHAIDYIVVDKREDILAEAEDFAYWNVDEQENPSRSYHGNLKIHDNIICESYNEAVKKIDSLDKGWYDDHAVQFKDKSKLSPNKTMLSLEERMKKNREDKGEYIIAHSVQNRKSEFVTCPLCSSKIRISFLRRETCPVCGKDLRAEYVIDRLKKYDNDYNELKDKYEEAVKNRKDKCPVKWLVKVEVHC